MALAFFVESRRALAFSLGSGGEFVTWANRAWVERARNLRVSFKAADAIALLTEMLGTTEIENETSPIGTLADLRAPSVQPFAAMLHITANIAPLMDERARDIAHRSMERAPGSPVAVYLTSRPLDADQIQAHRKTQVSSSHQYPCALA